MTGNDLNRKEWLQGLAWLQHASEYDKARLRAALEDLIEALNEQALVLSNLAHLKGPVRSPQNEGRQASAVTVGGVYRRHVRSHEL